MKSSVCTLLLFFLGLCLVQLGWTAEEYESENMKEVRQYLKEMLVTLAENHENLQPVSGYGRVLDQHGDPVPGAKVEVHWSYYDPDQYFKIIVLDKWVIADGNGNFTFILQKAHEPYINQVKSRGYEFQPNLSPYFSAEPDEENSMMANLNNEPITIYMRKLNPTTFLLKSSVSYYCKEPNVTLSYTMIPGLLDPVKPNLSNFRKPEQHDLIFTVTKNEDDSSTMHIKPIPTIGGSIQILDDFFYEAPSGGYSQEATITIPSGDGKIKKYIYFTSRNPAVYSRMAINLRIRDDGKLSFGSTTRTNPYGKRNLEWEPDLPNKLRHILRKEAEKALQAGTLPEEPADLQQLIEQYSGQ